MKITCGAGAAVPAAAASSVHPARTLASLSRQPRDVVCTLLAAGPKLGFWLVLPCQLIMMVGLGIVYSVTGGKSLYRIYHLYYPGTAFGISLWILIFGICQVFISLVRSACSCCPCSCCLRPRTWLLVW